MIQELLLSTRWSALSKTAKHGSNNRKAECMTDSAMRESTVPITSSASLSTAYGRHSSSLNIWIQII